MIGNYISASGAQKSGKLNVNVVGQDFTNNPACWVGQERDWQFTLPPEAVFDADLRLITGAMVPAKDGGLGTKLLVDDNVSRCFVARLGEGGPILGAGAAN